MAGVAQNALLESCTFGATFGIRVLGVQKIRGTGVPYLRVPVIRIGFRLGSPILGNSHLGLVGCGNVF